MSFRHRLRRVLPPVLVEELRRISAGGIRFSGDYPNWQVACGDAIGYGSEEILRRVTDATRQVVAGKAAFERDSVLFAKLAYPYPLLAALLRAAALNGGHLRVIDFGGSLGSTFRQCRPFLDGLASIRWCVVEQPGFADVGAKEFSTKELFFAASPGGVFMKMQGGVALLSSVLQYVENPVHVLDELAQTGATSLVIDRTPLSQLSRDRLCVQTVPAKIYTASYPAWIFSRDKLMSTLARDWRLLAEFDSEEAEFLTRDRLRFRF